jgi:hypothetical protein
MLIPLLLAATAASASVDVTHRYHELASPKLEEPALFDRIRLKPFRVLLVPGLATDTTESIGRVTGPLGITAPEGFLSAFHQQRRWMDEAGVDYEVAPINRRGSCDDNGDAIVDAILRSPKPVIVVTQSKGGVDTLHGLVRYPTALGKIAGWVAYQPPLAGSPLADLLQDRRAVRAGSNLLFRLMGGTGLALRDMTTSFRAEYKRLYAPEIERVIRAIPIVTLVTTEYASSWRKYLFAKDRSDVAFLGPFVETIRLRGFGMNDGIATVEGTCLETAHCVYLDGIDHFAAVMDTGPFKTLDRQSRVAMFRALLELVSDRHFGLVMNSK